MADVGRGVASVLADLGNAVGISPDEFSDAARWMRGSTATLPVVAPAAPSAPGNPGGGGPYRTPALDSDSEERPRRASRMAWWDRTGAEVASIEFAGDHWTWCVSAPAPDYGMRMGASTSFAIAFRAVTEALFEVCHRVSDLACGPQRAGDVGGLSLLRRLVRSLEERSLNEQELAALDRVRADLARIASWSTPVAEHVPHLRLVDER